MGRRRHFRKRMPKVLYYGPENFHGCRLKRKRRQSGKRIDLRDGVNYKDCPHFKCRIDYRNIAKCHPWARRILMIREDGYSDKLIIKVTRTIHGRGLFTKTFIPENKMIMEYTGERISFSEAWKRANLKKRSYIMDIDNNLFVDAEKYGNSSKYLNHSCNPNCEAVIYYMDDEDVLIIQAKRNIKPGEELTIDYKYNQNIIKCRCKSANCRGYL